VIFCVRGWVRSSLDVATAPVWVAFAAIVVSPFIGAFWLIYCFRASAPSSSNNRTGEQKIDSVADFFAESLSLMHRLCDQKRFKIGAMARKDSNAEGWRAFRELSGQLC
jgi:hypothetical protein